MKNIPGKLAGICVILVFVMIVSGVLSYKEEIKILDQKCQELGYLEYEYNIDFNFCADAERNLHYIDYECDYKINFLGLFPKSCDLYEITVGEVEVKK